MQLNPTIILEGINQKALYIHYTFNINAKSGLGSLIANLNRFVFHHDIYI